MSHSALPPNDKEMSLVEHLLELRNRLTKAVLAVIVLFVALFPFANDLYLFIAEPLMRYMPSDGGMIATAVASPSLTPFKLSLVLAIYLAMPVILYQLWAFIAPGLYEHEKKLVGPLLFSSVFLFYAGGVFAYYVVFPLVFQFLTGTAPDGVTIATDISMYLDFVIKMFFAFGIAFEVPIATVLLIITGITTPEKLSHARPYVIVGAFVIGMLLTPPDIISQTLLAVPMWILYELGVWIGAMIVRRRKSDDDEPDTDDDPEPQDPTPSPGPAPTRPDSGGYPTDAESAAPARTSAAAATAATAGSLAVQAAAEPGLSFDADGQPQTPPPADDQTFKAVSETAEDEEDDDFDWDAEFDQIEAEMNALHGENDAETPAEAYNEAQEGEIHASDTPRTDTQPGEKTGR